MIYVTHQHFGTFYFLFAHCHTHTFATVANQFSVWQDKFLALSFFSRIKNDYFDLKMILLGLRRRNRKSCRKSMALRLLFHENGGKVHLTSVIHWFFVLSFTLSLAWQWNTVVLFQQNHAGILPTTHMKCVSHFSCDTLNTVLAALCGSLFVYAVFVI